MRGESTHDEVPLDCSGDLTVRWCYRAAGGDVVGTVRDATWPAGRVQAFVHGETSAVRALRSHLLDDRGVPRELLSISGYWRRGLDEEAFRADKRAGHGVAA